MDIIEVPYKEIIAMQNEIMDLCLKKGWPPEATCFAMVSLGFKIAMKRSPDYEDCPEELFDAAIAFNQWLEQNDPINGPMAGNA